MNIAHNGSICEHKRLRKPSIQNIDCLDIPEKMKWDSNGKLLGFIDEEKIKIYRLKI